MSGGQASAPPRAARGDWRALRAYSEAALARLEAVLDECPSVSRTDHQATSSDGSSVLVRWYTPAGRDR